MTLDQPTPLHSRAAPARDHPSLEPAARDQLPAAERANRWVTSSGRIPEVTPAVARPARVSPLTRSEHPATWPTSRREGVLIIHAEGPVDADFADRLGRLLDSSGEATIVNLSEASVTHPEALAALDPARSHRRSDELCVATRHATHRELLANRLDNVVAVFAHASDALQARLLARLGYGQGWRTDCQAPSRHGHRCSEERTGRRAQGVRPPAW